MIGSYSHTNIMGSKLALFDENNQIAILETGLSNPDLKEKFVNLKFISAAQQ